MLNGDIISLDQLFLTGDVLAVGELSLLVRSKEGGKTLLASKSSYFLEFCALLSKSIVKEGNFSLKTAMLLSQFGVADLQFFQESFQFGLYLSQSAIFLLKLSICKLQAMNCVVHCLLFLIPFHFRTLRFCLEHPIGAMYLLDLCQSLTIFCFCCF